MQHAAELLLFGLVAAAAVARGEDIEIAWPPKTSLKGDLTAQIASPITFNPLGVQSPWKGATTKSLDVKWDTTVGGADVSLDTNTKFPARSNVLSMQRTFGSVCCKVASESGWPLKPVASIKGTVSAGEAGTLCYDLKTPISGASLSGDIKLKKKVGDAMCSLSTPAVYPPEATASIEKKVGPICCTLKAPVSDYTKASASATYSKTFDTEVGPVCCKVEGSGTASGTFRATGTASLKKKIGAVCANLEANTNGVLKCSFDTAWDSLVETSTGFSKFIGMAFWALAGAFVGSGTAIVVLRRARQSAATGCQVPLLEA